LTDHPDCAASLRKEWELALPAEDFERMVLEPTMAERILVASSFTKRTLIENGTPASAITVIPYGVNLQRFTPRRRSRSSAGPLRLLFAGTINQRKGIKYLVEALRILRHRQIQLTVCGRVVDDLSVLKLIASQIDLRPSVSADELVSAYQEADLFVLPSVAEGFGQVLLEALACGVPVLSTRRTAAPDLVDEGVHGFVVEPRRADLLAERIEWALCHRVALAEMRLAARERAEQFHWNRFGESVVEAVLPSLGGAKDSPREALAQHV
jgi:glycosyltransferase involved in cell wall biosynthesis